MFSLLIPYPHFDPVAFRILGWPVRWYALMYLVAFAVGYVILRRRLHQLPYRTITRPSAWTTDQLESILTATILGVVLGGRLGYCLFYDLGHYLRSPLDVLKVNEGGMSFHGGAIGVVIALAFMAWRLRRPFLQMTDFLVPAVAPGLAFGRWGNFINGELWGRVAGPDVPWAMVFPGAGPEPRHPSQLYELLLEGVLLGAIVLLYARHSRARGTVSGLFVMGYGLLRFIAENFRQPDAQLGLLALGMSMGQWLCVPMILGGAGLWLWAWRRGIDDTEHGTLEPGDG